MAALVPYIFGCELPVHGPTKSRSHLVNLFLSLAKLTVYLIRKEAVVGRVPKDCEATFLSLVGAHLRAEYHWAVSSGFLGSFGDQWALSSVLCLVAPLGTLVLRL